VEATLLNYPFQMWKTLRTRIQNWRQQNEKRLEIGLFVGGFLFDAVMVKEPDEIFAILQQVFYLFTIAIILHYQLLADLNVWSPGQRVQKIWKYREFLLPFCLGTLLNVYSIFYIKSASMFSSLIFLVLMIGFILANEHPKVKKSGVSFKIGLFGICLFSFFAILYPILMGFIGWLPFSLAIATTGGLLSLEYFLVRRKLGSSHAARQAVLLPSISVLLLFLAFYFLGWIPPVPLSVKEQGVYHLVQAEGGKYLLSTQKEWWQFWRSGDEEFGARPGDKIYFYAQIYSPAHFSDAVVLHWLHKDPLGHWQSLDKIPMRIVGGRKDGFRGYTVKANYQPGRWRIQVETKSGLEISRLYFDVIPEAVNTEARQFSILTR